MARLWVSIIVIALFARNIESTRQEPRDAKYQIVKVSLIQRRS